MQRLREGFSMTKTGHILLWGWANALIAVTLICGLDILCEGKLEGCVAFISLLLGAGAYAIGAAVAEEHYNS